MAGTRTKKHTPDRVNVRRGMKTYSIPVDSNGKVPKWAIVQRYQEVGSRKDKDLTDSLTLSSDLTPEEIVDWWADPSVCDIEGIDTADSEIYSVPLSIQGRKRKALKNIAVLADKKESDRIKKCLAKSFSAEELEEMASGRSLLVRTEPRLDDCTGFYLRRQEGVEVPQIILEDGTTPDGIVHEAVHHLRATDGRTAFPTYNGKLDDTKYRKLSKAQKDEVVRREETETVVETVARTKIDKVPSGYYDDIPGMNPKNSYLHDQKTVSGSRALKGRKAVRAAEENYDRCCISRAIIASSSKKRSRR